MTLFPLPNASVPVTQAPARSRRAQAPRGRGGVAAAWLFVVHPNPEIAASRAATARAAFPGTAVRPSSRASDLVRSDRELPAGAGAVLVHVDGVDRFRSGWAGHRLVARLAEQGTPAVAWVAAGDRDGLALALRSGAAGIYAACAHDAHRGPERVPEMRAAVRGALTPNSRPAVHACPNRHVEETDADLGRWFEARYGSAWQAWMEDAVAVIAGGGERTEQAEALRAALLPATSDHALRRLRQITEMLCGEIRGNEANLRREAIVVLGRVARVRPIQAQPCVTRSMQRAARLLEADPKLALEAGLSPGAARDLIEVAQAELDATLRPVKRRGRPEAGAWRLRRDLALGRVAERRGSTAAEKIDVLQRLRASLDDTLSAVYDALEDRERPAAD